jgi:hydroxymethylpyrimidine/phosphomethylpyrimidine kinase
MKKILSIAGFDGSGGAGIQADLKTFAAHGCYGLTVLTALPVQNTTGVKSCYEIPIKAIEEQLEAIFSDIKPDAIKIGMLFNEAVIHVVADYLIQQAVDIPIVLDPVMVATSGDRLLQPEAIAALITRLIPLCAVITPNLPEAEVLTGKSPRSLDEQSMPDAAKKILELGAKAVLLKGGHLPGDSCKDLFCFTHQQGVFTFFIDTVWLESPKIPTKNTHGTGCTLSSAIAANLALGFDLLESCQRAKNYLQKAIEAAKDQKIGNGAGPVAHFL